MMPHIQILRTRFEQIVEKHNSKYVNFYNRTEFTIDSRDYLELTDMLDKLFKILNPEIIKIGIDNESNK